MTHKIEFISNISNDYEVFLLDLWGVIHDGTQLYDGAAEVLSNLHARNKPVVLLSNAPRRAVKVKRVLDALCVREEWYKAIVTSGEVAYLHLKQGKIKPGKRYYFLGPERDADVLDGLDFIRVYMPEQADFALNVGFGSESDSETEEDIASELAACHAAGLPMLCLNPDLEVVKITGERYICAGLLAKQYEQLGGKVSWFGKPYPDVYSHALEIIGVEKDKVLAVGDGLHTDIEGAVNAGIANVLITGGILQGKWQPGEGGTQPDYYMDAFRW